MSVTRTVTAALKERNFMFSSGSDRAEVECLNCGWIRHPGWVDYQRVFDLSNDHECAGVETFAHMRARVAAENARDNAGRREYERVRTDKGAPHWFALDQADRETWRVQAEAGAA